MKQAKLLLLPLLIILPTSVFKDPNVGNVKCAIYRRHTFGFIKRRKEQSYPRVNNIIMKIIQLLKTDIKCNLIWSSFSFTLKPKNLLRKSLSTSTVYFLNTHLFLYVMDDECGHTLST